MSSSLDTLLGGLPRTLIRAPSASVAAGAGFLPAHAIGGHGIAVTNDRARSLRRKPIIGRRWPISRVVRLSDDESRPAPSSACGMGPPRRNHIAHAVCKSGQDRDGVASLFLRRGRRMGVTAGGPGPASSCVRGIPAPVAGKPRRCQYKSKVNLGYLQYKFGINIPSFEFTSSVSVIIVAGSSETSRF